MTSWTDSTYLFRLPEPRQRSWWPSWRPASLSFPCRAGQATISVEEAARTPRVEAVMTLLAVGPLPSPNIKLSPVARTIHQRARSAVGLCQHAVTGTVCGSSAISASSWSMFASTIWASSWEIWSLRSCGSGWAAGCAGTSPASATGTTSRSRGRRSQAASSSF